MKTAQTNYIAVCYTAKLAIHYLNRNKPGSDRSLIFTCSIGGYIDQPGMPQYSGAKWGVRGLMRSLRHTCPQYGIRVNLIAPWFVRTPIVAQEAQKVVEATGIGFADVSDAAAAVLHLACDPDVNGEWSPILSAGLLYAIRVLMLFQDEHWLRSRGTSHQKANMTCNRRRWDILIWKVTTSTPGGR